MTTVKLHYNSIVLPVFTILLLKHDFTVKPTLVTTSIKPQIKLCGLIFNFLPQCISYIEAVFKSLVYTEFRFIQDSV